MGENNQSMEARSRDPFSDSAAEGGALGLGLSRVVIQSHGGELRLVRVSATQSRFEVELPVIEGTQPQIGAALPEIVPGQVQLTVLLVEPDWIYINPALDLWLDVATFERAFALVEGIPGQKLDASRVEALRDAWRERRFTMEELDRAARACRVERVMRPYVEAVVELRHPRPRAAVPERPHRR